MKDGYGKFFKAAQQAKTEPTKNTESQRIHQQLSKMVEKRKKKVAQQRKPLPWISFLVGGLMVLGLGYLAMEEQTPMDILNRLEVNWMGQVSASNAGAGKDAAKKSEAGEPKAETSAAVGENKVTAKAPASGAASEEELNHFGKLRERKSQLDQRETELDELETELHKQKSEIEARIVHLEKVRDQIAQILKDRVQMDDEKVAKLVEFYSNMKPSQAAGVMGSINEDLAVEILGRMKKKNAAEIMNLLKPEKAQVISEKFAGYKRR